MTLPVDTAAAPRASFEPRPESASSNERSATARLSYNLGDIFSKAVSAFEGNHPSSFTQICSKALSFCTVDISGSDNLKNEIEARKREAMELKDLLKVVIIHAVPAVCRILETTRKVLKEGNVHLEIQLPAVRFEKGSVRMVEPRIDSGAIQPPAARNVQAAEPQDLHRELVGTLAGGLCLGLLGFLQPPF